MRRSGSVTGAISGGVSGALRDRRGPRRLLLINPCNPLVNITNRANRWNRYRVWKPLGLLVLAGVTPRPWDIEVVDENLETPDYRTLPLPDLVGITAFTSQAPRAYEVAALWRQRGVPVVMGGIHATMRPHEAARYVDAVVTGEAETAWLQLLEDFRQGALQPLYEGGLEDLRRSRPARHDLLSGGYSFGAIQTTRGCPLHCSFCSVSAFNGRAYRHRAIADVIADLRLVPEKRVLIVDDNLIGTSRKHIARTKELLRAMIAADLGKTWICQATINIADDDELLELARQAGCKGVFIGFESPTAEGLIEVHKRYHVQRERDFPASVRRIQRHGTPSPARFIGLVDRPGIGGSYHVDFLNVMFLTPLPGTVLWQKMEAEGDRHRPVPRRLEVLHPDPARGTLPPPRDHHRRDGDCNRRFYSWHPRVGRNLLHGNNPSCPDRQPVLPPQHQAGPGSLPAIQAALRGGAAGTPVAAGRDRPSHPRTGMVQHVQRRRFDDGGSAAGVIHHTGSTLPYSPKRSRIMKTTGYRVRPALLTLGLAVALMTSAAAQDATTTEGQLSATAAMFQQARNHNWDLYAPKTFEEARESLARAQERFHAGGKIDGIREELDKARTRLAAAERHVEIGAVVMTDAIAARSDALAAGAPDHAPDQWKDAKEAMHEAGRRVEKGESNNARKKAAEAESEFRTAELRAIRVDLLGGAPGPGRCAGGGRRGEGAADLCRGRPGAGCRRVDPEGRPLPAGRGQGPRAGRGRRLPACHPHRRPGRPRRGRRSGAVRGPAAAARGRPGRGGEDPEHAGRLHRRHSRAGASHPRGRPEPEDRPQQPARGAGRDRDPGRFARPGADGGRGEEAVGDRRHADRAEAPARPARTAEPVLRRRGLGRPAGRRGDLSASTVCRSPWARRRSSRRTSHC